MFLGGSRKSVAAFLLLAAPTLGAADPSYRSVSIDDNGQLHIVPTSGTTILPKKIEGQLAFSDARISTDLRTVGWLVEPTICGELAIYRAGRILPLFTTEQVFWDWRFEDGGKRVAYSTGPTHGGAAISIFREVDTGRVVAQWLVDSGKDPPSWARNVEVYPSTGDLHVLLRFIRYARRRALYPPRDLAFDGGNVRVCSKH